MFLRFTSLLESFLHCLWYNYIISNGTGLLCWQKMTVIIFLVSCQRSCVYILQFHNCHFEMRMVNDRRIDADVLVSELAVVKRKSFSISFRFTTAMSASISERHADRVYTRYWGRFVTWFISLNIFEYFFVLFSNSTEELILMSLFSSSLASINSSLIRKNLWSIWNAPYPLVSLWIIGRRSLRFLKTAELLNWLFDYFIVPWTDSITLDKSNWLLIISLTSRFSLWQQHTIIGIPDIFAIHRSTEVLSASNARHQSFKVWF